MSTPDISANRIPNTSNLTYNQHHHHYAVVNRTLTQEERDVLVICFSILTTVGFFGNLFLLLHIIGKKLYVNFVSSHFIGHLCLGNMLATGYLVPMYIYSLWQGNDNIFSDGLFGDNGNSADDKVQDNNSIMCMFYAFTTYTIQSVIFYMTTCVAGVHLLTFARIHYDQLFGLPPSVICLLSWVIGLCLSLPTLTNQAIVGYDPHFYTCFWDKDANGYKFLSYIMLLGVLLPLWMTFYSYVRILGIFYHSPIVFQALGLYRSRFLVYGFILLQFCQLPFYISRIMDTESPWLYPISFFSTYVISIIGPLPYGLSLFMMKEEDQAMLARSHGKPGGGPSYTAAIPGAGGQHEL